MKKILLTIALTACLLTTSTVISQDKQAAEADSPYIQYLIEKAENGDTNAMYNLGICYE